MAPFPYRDRLALALDYDDLVEALALMDDVKEYFGIAKVGLELFSAAGPDVIAALRERDIEVFVDLKLHDTPATVHKAARVLGAVGASYVSVHAQGGYDMVRAGVDGLIAGAQGAGLAVPAALAVTVLASDNDAPPHIVPKRVDIARRAGCAGVVCAAGDLGAVRRLGGNLLAAVAGIRGADDDGLPGGVTIESALNAGADFAIVGRLITGASNPAAAAAQVVAGLLEFAGAGAPVGVGAAR